MHIRRVPGLPEGSSLALILSRTFCHYLLMMLSFFLFFSFLLSEDIGLPMDLEAVPIGVPYILWEHKVSQTL